MRGKETAKVCFEAKCEKISVGKKSQISSSIKLFEKREREKLNVLKRQEPEEIQNNHIQGGSVPPHFQYQNEKNLLSQQGAFLH